MLILCIVCNLIILCELTKCFKMQCEYKNYYFCKFCLNYCYYIMTNSLNYRLSQNYFFSKCVNLKLLFRSK